jgi:hypothetical protein
VDTFKDDRPTLGGTQTDHWRFDWGAVSNAAVTVTRQPGGTFTTKLYFTGVMFSATESLRQPIVIGGDWTCNDQIDDYAQTDAASVDGLLDIAIARPGSTSSANFTFASPPKDPGAGAATSNKVTCTSPSVAGTRIIRSGIEDVHRLGAQPLRCDPQDPSTTQTISGGLVKFGDPFTVTVDCINRPPSDPGRVQETETNVHINFIPCPNRGRDVQHCGPSELPTGPEPPLKRPPGR